MKPHLLLSLSIFFCLTVHAQFTEVQVLEADHNTRYGVEFRCFADLNGDGEKDLVLADSWLLATEEGDFSQPTYFDTSYEFLAFFPVDIEGDGDIDLVPRMVETVEQIPVEGVLALINDGEGNLGLQQVLGFLQAAVLLADDMDGDSDPDLLISDGDKLSWYLNAEGFDAADKVDVFELQGSRYYGMPSVADVDEDGYLDLLMFNFMFEYDDYWDVTTHDLILEWWQNQGANSFAGVDLYIEYLEQPGYSDLFHLQEEAPHVGDFNNDGWQDVLFYYEEQWQLIQGSSVGFSPSEQWSEDCDDSLVLSTASGEQLLCVTDHTLEWSADLFNFDNLEVPGHELEIEGNDAAVLAEDYLEIGFDQLILSNKQRSQIELYYPIEEGGWNMEVLYQADISSYTDYAVLDQNEDGHLDILLFHKTGRLLETMWNNDTIPLDAPGSRNELSHNPFEYVFNQERLFVIEGSSGDERYMVEYLTDEQGQVIDKDSLFLAWPSGSNMHIFKVLSQDFFSEGDINALMYGGGELSLQSIDGNTSNSYIKSMSGSGNSKVFDIVDVDGDGDQDVFYTNESSSAEEGIFVLENNGQELLGPVKIEADVEIDKAYPVFLDGDDLVDFLAVTKSDSLVLLTQTADGGASFQQLLYGATTLAFPHFFDADLDGDQDFAVFIYENALSPEINRFYTNNGDGTVTESELMNDPGFSYFEAADLVGDAHPELIQYTNGLNRLRIYANDLSVEEPPLYSGSLQEENSLSLFPNPSKDYLQIEGLQETAEYQIFDLRGSVLHRGSLDPASPFLNLAGLPDGIYTIRIDSAGEGMVFRFLVLGE